MATSSSLIILLFKFVLYLTTATSVLLHFEFAKEVDNAVKKLALPEKMKDTFSKHYINVGGYSKSFIELLDSYSTMSGSPIRFDEKEKLILTSGSRKDPIKYKVRTQLKYYRKMQEVQCTDYFILYYNLFDASWNIQRIFQHVYNMLKMVYFGKFLVFPWLLKLHINLMTPPGWNQKAWILLTMRDGLYNVEQYKKPLSELVSMCAKHKYLEKKSPKGCSEKISEHDMFNTKLHIHFDNNNKSPLPFSFDYLYLSNIRLCRQHFKPITSITTGWKTINNIFQNAINRVTAHLTTGKFNTFGDWRKDPFKHIECQQLFLDIVRVKLYNFVRVELIAYQRVDVSEYKYRLDIFHRLDYFMSRISDTVEYIDIGDRTLNEVLTLYSIHEKGKSNYEQNEKLLKIITTEIDNMDTCELPGGVSLATISEDDLNTERAFILFLGNVEKAFLEFENFLKTKLDGFSLKFLLLFVNGINYTELAVFPKPFSIF